MSFTRQLSEMSASELNDAIDDTNFPQAHILSRGRNNSVCSTSSTPSRDRTLSQTEDISPVNGTGAGFSDFSNSAAMTHARPKLVLKTNGIIAEREETTSVSSSDSSSGRPKTPCTPRTSTTPGDFSLFFFFGTFFSTYTTLPPSYYRKACEIVFYICITTTNA